MTTRRKHPNKWGAAYWQDLAERVGTTAVYGIITLLTTTSIQHVTVLLGWTIVLLPTVLSFLKGLLVNLSGSAPPSASLVDVTSTHSKAA